MIPHRIHAFIQNTSDNISYVVWRDLKTLIEVTSRWEMKGKESVEKRYYISNMALMAEKAMSFARSHWGIENHLHWIMDVVFKLFCWFLWRGTEITYGLYPCLLLLLQGMSLYAGEKKLV